MFALLSSVFSGLMSGLVGPLFTWLNKKQDDTLVGFQTATGADTVAYQAYLQYQVQIGAQKAAANSWWGARLLYMIVGGAAALHTAAVFIDSTVRLGCGHYGCLGVPSLPAAPTDYASYERMVVYSLFVVSTLGPPASAVTAWLHKK